MKKIRRYLNDLSKEELKKLVYDDIKVSSKKYNQSLRTIKRWIKIIEAGRI